MAAGRNFREIITGLENSLIENIQLIGIGTHADNAVQCQVLGVAQDVQSREQFD